VNPHLTPHIAVWLAQEDVQAEWTGWWNRPNPQNPYHLSLPACFVRFPPPRYIPMQWWNDPIPTTMGDAAGTSVFRDKIVSKCLRHHSIYRANSIQANGPEPVAVDESSVQAFRSAVSTALHLSVTI
jgi:hypothetical protein